MDPDSRDAAGRLRSFLFHRPYELVKVFLAGYKRTASDAASRPYATNMEDDSLFISEYEPDEPEKAQLFDEESSGDEEPEIVRTQHVTDLQLRKDIIITRTPSLRGQPAPLPRKAAAKAQTSGTRPSEDIQRSTEVMASAMRKRQATAQHSPGTQLFQRPRVALKLRRSRSPSRDLSSRTSHRLRPVPQQRGEREQRQADAKNALTEREPSTEPEALLTGQTQVHGQTEEDRLLEHIAGGEDY